MRTTAFLAIGLLLSATAFSQSSLETTRDASGNKVLKGFVDRRQLAADTAFGWYAQNSRGYTPPADAVQGLAAGKDSVHYLVFGGTWCGDTKYLLPRFFAAVDAAGIPDNRITLLGVDHDKKTLFHLSEAFQVTRVPTFIVLKNGKEVGRVVEYGQTGNPEKEVAALVAGAVKK